MDLGLTGKRAVVLASTRSIGFACARMLAAEGCEVVLNGRSKASVFEARERVLAEIPEARISGVPVDLSDAFEVAGLAERIAGGGLRCDILVNNTNGPPVQRVADTQVRNVSAVHPIFAEIETSAAHSEACSPRCSETILTARSRTSGE